MNKPDYSRIPYPSIPKLLKEAGIQEPAELKACCFNGNEQEYLKHELKHEIAAPIEQVWNGYKKLHPAVSWQTEMIRFGFMYSRQTDSYLYDKSEPYESIAKGQVYLVNLHLLGKGLQIAVGHEVDLIDEEEKIIKICYLNTGKTAGSQWIKFTEAGPSLTRISHTTLYKGTSFFRDRILYPIFHKRAMDQFHEHMKKLILD